MIPLCKMKPILLASASPRRTDLLKLLNLDFSSFAADIDETPLPQESALELVTRLSRAKAYSITLHNMLVIGADTVVELPIAAGTDGLLANDGVETAEILGKPQDDADAARMLRKLRGRPHFVYTGISLNDDPTWSDSKPNLPEQSFCVRSRVWMREYSDSEINAYVSSGDPLDKAAAYGVQNSVFHPIASIEGCFANVMGLPLCHLYHALANHIDLTSPQIECHLHPEENCTVEKIFKASTSWNAGPTSQLPPVS